MLITFAVAANARTTNAVALPLITKPGIIKYKPDSAETVNSIKSSGEVTPPYSIVNLTDDVELLTAYNQISSKVVAVVEPV